MRYSWMFWGGLLTLLAGSIALLAVLGWRWAHAPASSVESWHTALILAADVCGFLILFYIAAAAAIHDLILDWRDSRQRREHRRYGPDDRLLAPRYEGELPSLMAAPIVLRWQFSPAMRWFLSCIIPGTANQLWSILGPKLTPPQFWSSLNPFLAGGLVIASIFVLVYIVQALLARPATLVVSEHGLELRAFFVRRRSLRWQDVQRLDYNLSRDRYTVLGDRQSISWEGIHSRAIHPIGLSREQAAERWAQVPALIEERTGLKARALV